MIQYSRAAKLAGPVEIVVYCAYGDESRDGTAKRVYAVAGVFGHESDWEALKPIWTERLNGKIFHAADCEAGHGDFKGMEEQERRKLYRDLTGLIVKSPLMGHGCAINVVEYKQSFQQDFEHAPYLWAFGDIVGSMSELAAVAIPVEQVHVTFDRNQDIEHNATAIYDFILHSKKAITRHFLADTVAFACRRTVGIQVADLFARETMKYLDGQIGGVARPRRGSFIALSETKRFRFTALGKSVFEDKKRRLGGAYTDRASLSEYRKWLDKNRLQDCLSNRVVHLKEFPELWDNKS